MRPLPALIALALLAGCAPRMSETPVRAPVPSATPQQGYSGGAAPAISSDELRAAGLPSAGRVESAPLGEGAPTPAPPPVFEGRSSSASSSRVESRVDTNNPRISDEQSFEAVAARESIESDAARLEANAAAYRQVQPRPVPVQTGEDGPNIVRYALRTSHPVGTRRYSRFTPFSGGERIPRACAEYSSPDQAQRAFLTRGGPERDRLGLDPDGDGFACGWDPAPFRAARG